MTELFFSTNIKITTHQSFCQPFSPPESTFLTIQYQFRGSLSASLTEFLFFLFLHSPFHTVNALCFLRVCFGGPTNPLSLFITFVSTSPIIRLISIFSPCQSGWTLTRSVFFPPHWEIFCHVSVTAFPAWRPKGKRVSVERNTSRRTRPLLQSAFLKIGLLGTPWVLSLPIRHNWARSKII